ncbi:MAG: hypothetical protein HON29_03365 [Candidatus Magasanikbacteria bacterium]|nr:hypothetical protein [Candidatus Magasanikbacteria bacterium]
MSDNFFMLGERKSQVLGLVVERYIDSVQPVGSRVLFHTDHLSVSEATIRNELRALEDAGYLTHPHTSAGRVPTELGYKYYIAHIMQTYTIKKDTKDDVLRILADEQDQENVYKNIAKYVSYYSGNAALLAFSRHRVYYTGMSHLFSQPEFQDYANTVQVSGIFDHCEDRMHLVREGIKRDGVPQVLVGHQNPLGGACSIVVTALPGDIILLILGPIRMRYKENSAIIHFLHTVLHN